MENQSDCNNITRGLADKGYSDEDIRKVIGGNLIRMVKGSSRLTLGE
jgi:membrane dipeptidase